jgi:hypothetical protein
MLKALAVKAHLGSAYPVPQRITLRNYVIRNVMDNVMVCSLLLVINSFILLMYIPTTKGRAGLAAK